VPPGAFQMGCIMGSNQSEYYSWELPLHQVTLTTAFYLCRYELTQSQWVVRMGSSPSYFVSGNGHPGSDARPVERVSRNSVQGYLSATGFRLPTEAEWEYACRAGTQTPFHSGPGFPDGTTDNNLVSQIAWINCNDGCGTKPVGGKAANELGFHDMLGNVWEWVNDRYGGYMSEAPKDPTGSASASARVIRGGSWGLGTDYARSSIRNSLSSDSAGDNIGFRVARTP
jgi:formylglycine-generating enzyme required for sulfatase activity